MRSTVALVRSRPLSRILCMLSVGCACSWQNESRDSAQSKLKSQTLLPKSKLIVVPCIFKRTIRLMMCPPYLVSAVALPPVGAPFLGSVAFVGVSLATCGLELRHEAKSASGNMRFVLLSSPVSFAGMGLRTWICMPFYQLSTPQSQFFCAC